MKKNFLVLFVLLLLTGCTAVEKESDLFDVPPFYASFELNEKFYFATPGSYSWTMKKFLESYTVAADYAAPFEHAKEIEVTRLPAGKTVYVVVDGNPSIKMVEWFDENNSKEVQLDEKKYTLPDEVGEYIYEIKGEWKNGYRSYVIKVEIY